MVQSGGVGAVLEVIANIALPEPCNPRTFELDRCLGAGAVVVAATLMSGGADKASMLARLTRLVDDVPGAGKVDNVIKRTNCRTGGHSFSADTVVLMANGATTPISEVDVGDRVFATNPETGMSGPATVTATWPHHDTLLQLNTTAGTITTTEDHEFWNDTDQTWQQTQHLDPGDLLLTATGETVSVEGLDWTTTHHATAYDLTIDTYHTYYIQIGDNSDTHTLVHNTDTCLPRFDGPKPTYHVNPAHVPGRGLRPGKTPLPSDAEVVFRTAVPNDPYNPTAWFGRNADGQTYRFSLGNDGTAHFSGIDGVGDGVRNLLPYARQRLDLLAG